MLGSADAERSAVSSVQQYDAVTKFVSSGQNNGVYDRLSMSSRTFFPTHLKNILRVVLNNLRTCTLSNKLFQNKNIAFAILSVFYNTTATGSFAINVHF